MWRCCRQPAGVFLVALALVSPTIARAEPPRGRFQWSTPEQRHSISRGFNYLLRRQKESGSFRGSSYPVAVNALVGLALLTGGTTQDAGSREEYVEALRTCTSTLLEYQDDKGYFSDKGSRMYGHGFATLFLAELYGMGGRREERVRDSLRRAIRVIESAQRGEGGWDYFPDRRVLPSSASDTSITVCQTMALRAARNLGIQVRARVIDDAKRYIIGSQNKDGGFRYRSQGLYSAAISSFPRSAAGVCILYSLGDYSSPGIKRGIAYLEKHYRDNNEFPFYAQYYCSQAMFQVGGDRWRTYFNWVRSRLLKDQRQDGSWRSRPFQLETNPEQTTAMALIVLQLPYRLLPIHER